MNIRFNIIIGILFILAGLLLGSDYFVHIIKPVYAEPVINKITNEPKITEPIKIEESAVIYYPTHVNVPSVSVSVDVEIGYYDYAKDTWTVSDDVASFMSVTAVPNHKSGNTYIYGHNRSNLFANLNNLKIGEKAEVMNSKNEIFNYKLSSIHDVSPDDLSMLSYNGTPILTLQTCSGVFDQNRRLFIFNLEGSI